MNKSIIILFLLISTFIFSQDKLSDVNIKKEKTEDSASTSSATNKEELKSKKSEESSSGLTQEEFELKLKNLETDVNLLKEKIFRSKARLATLQETLISGKSIQSAKLVINHVNKFSHFDIKSIIYHFDGKPLYAVVDTDGSISKLKKKTLYDGVIIPGNHMLSIVVKLEISELGLFDYSKGYQFQVKASHSFHIEEGKVTTINIVLKEKGGYFNNLTEKPDVAFEAGVTKDLTASDIKKK